MIRLRILKRIDHPGVFGGAQWDPMGSQGVLGVLSDSGREIRRCCAVGFENDGRGRETRMQTASRSWKMEGNVFSACISLLRLP